MASQEIEIEIEFEEIEEPEEPQEEDLFTEDHREFYEVGGDRRPVVSVEEDEDWEDEVKAFMNGQNYFRNVWFISDHGNAHLMTFSA